MKFWISTAFMPPEHYVPVAKAADEAGIHGVMMSDHIFFPQKLESKYPYSPYPDGRPIWDPHIPWPDPWVTIGAMAGSTENLHFGTSIYIAPARDLFTVAKLVGTASVLSNGRVNLGLGAGWMKEEFDQTGQSYENRGPRLDEMIAALRALWGGGWVEHHGDYYDFGPLQIEPAPADGVPIWCGGVTKRALRRAAHLCDGWLSNGCTEDELDAYLATLRELRKEVGRENEPFENIVSVYAPPSKELFGRLEEKGVTGFMTMPWYVAQDETGIADAQQVDELTRKRDAIFRFADQWVS